MFVEISVFAVVNFKTIVGSRSRETLVNIFADSVVNGRFLAVDFDNAVEFSVMVIVYIGLSLRS